MADEPRGDALGPPQVWAGLHELPERRGGGGVGSGAALLTVTEMLAEVVLLPAVSRATVVSVCEPLVAVVVFQEIWQS
ncbi:MAG: hypothetical protein ACREA0_13720 [bacterium]